MMILAIKKGFFVHKMCLRLIFFSTILTINPLIFSHQKVLAQTQNIPITNYFAQNNSLSEEKQREVDELNIQINELYQQGKYKEAINFAQQVLTIYQETLGEKNPFTAVALNLLGLLYSSQGDYIKAQPLYEKALTIRKEILGEKHTDTATSLNNLGLLYYELGNYPQAEILYKEALTIKKEVLGARQVDVALTLNNLALLYYEQGKYTEAEPLYLESLSIYRETLGNKNASTALTINNLALLYYELGDYNKAEPLYLETLAIYKETLGEKHPSTALTLNNLGLLYYEQGKYEQAESLYKQSLAIYKETLGEKNTSTALPIHNLASLYYDQGKYAEAEPLYKEALAIYREIRGEKHSSTAQSSNNLGLLYYQQGRYTEAESLYKQTLAIRKEILGEKHPDTAISYNNLGLLYFTQGNYTEAEPLYRQALAISKEVLGEKHTNTALYLNNLALLLYQKGDYLEAKKLYEQSLSIYKEVLGENHPSTALTMNNLALLYYDVGDYASAKKLFQQSLAIYQEKLGNNHPSVALSLNNVAGLALKDKDYPSAEKLYQQSLAIYQETLGKNHSSTAFALNNLAQLYWAEGNFDSALNYLTQGTEIEEYRLNIFVNQIGDESRKQAYINTLSGSTNWAISLNLNSIPNNIPANRLALTTIFRRKGRILDAMSNIIAILRQRMNPEISKLLDDLTEKRTQLASLSFEGIGKNTPSAYQALIQNLEAEIEKSEEKLSTESAEFKIENQPITIKSIQEAMPESHALIEYILYYPYHSEEGRWGKPRYAAYILQPNGEPQGIDLGDAEEINQLADLWLKNLIDLSNDDSDLAKFSQKLYEKIFLPVIPFLKNKESIFISPDSQLNLIPFAALQNQNQEYLVTKYQITYLTSGRDLLKLKNPVKSRSNSVIVANPNYDAKSEPILMASNRGSQKRSGDLSNIKWCCTPLPGTKLESEGIKILIPDSKLYSESQATVDVINNVKAPTILHLATHGFFLPDQKEQLNNSLLLQSDQKLPIITNENPLLRSGLAFAGFNPSLNQFDGALTALEASNLDLWGTKLVVLSACKTGVGDVHNGEGVYGLRRAFVLAGAESQLMSLWDVSDDGTKELMTQYYQRIMNHDGRSEALRQVQLEMLKSDKFSHPYYWGAFIPSGDWRSID